MKQVPPVIEATPAVAAAAPPVPTLTVIASNENAVCIDGFCELPPRP